MIAPLHIMESAPMTFQRHGPTTVSDHFPSQMSRTKCGAEIIRNSCHCECTVHESAEEHV